MDTRIKSEITRMTCPVHRQKPVIEIIDGRVKLECCCSDFKIECLQTIISLLQELNKD
ncbi:MAG TPA: hypothetical protein VK671_16650 [Mucilaginibacter sp.]|jgi:hypothetical protein|nr:hypothetical protein [Mucilaginibacter sp.]